MLCYAVENFTQAVGVVGINFREIIFYQISTLIFIIFLVLFLSLFYFIQDFSISLCLSDLVKTFCFETLVMKDHCMLKMFSTFVSVFVLYLIISCKVQNQ